MKSFFQTIYFETAWWTQTREISDSMFYIVLAIGCGTIILGILLKFFYIPDYFIQMWYKNKVVQFLIYCGIITGMISFTYWQELGIFSSYIFLAFVLVFSILWLGWIGNHFRKYYKTELASQKREKILQKYSLDRKRK